MTAIISHDSLYRYRLDRQVADTGPPCWGSRTKVSRVYHRVFDEVLGLLHASGKPVRAFGLTSGGDPAHPLYAPYDRPLVTLEATK